MRRYVRSIIFITALFSITASNIVVAQALDFPVPPHNPKQLFYLQRNANSNTLIYELNIENGVINKQNPIHVYWINYAGNGQTEELSDLQRKYAYGIKATEVSDNIFECYLVANKKLKLTVQEGDDKQYHAYTMMNEKKIFINRIYLQVKAGGLFKPRIDYVEMKGVDVLTGTAVEEKIKL